MLLPRRLACRAVRLGAGFCKARETQGIAASAFAACMTATVRAPSKGRQPGRRAQTHQGLRSGRRSWWRLGPSPLSCTARRPSCLASRICTQHSSTGYRLPRVRLAPSSCARCSAAGFLLTVAAWCRRLRRVGPTAGLRRLRAPRIALQALLGFRRGDSLLLRGEA